MNWTMSYKSVMVAMGNPIACLAVLFLDQSGWLIHSGTAFRFSFTGTLGVLVIGYLYIGICAGIRSLCRWDKNILINGLQYTGKMFKISIIGLGLTLMFISGSDWDILAFVLGIPILIFLVIYAGFSIYGVFSKGFSDTGFTIRDGEEEVK